MRKRRQTGSEEGPKVPGYIVTYSDMVTLLLTFFVMLLTLADVQDPELFDKGRDAFLESIRYLGLGTLFGRQNKPELGSVKSKYTIEEPDESSDTRTLDARKEELRRIFERLKKTTATKPPQITATTNNFSVANVHFEPGKAELDEASKSYLDKFCTDLRAGTGREALTLYVLGLAPEENTEQEQWILSAMRAEIAAKYLRASLASMFDEENDSSVFGPAPQWSVYSWGAGSGGEWSAPDGPGSNTAQLFIAILRQS